jgi:hypothetical protein
MPFRDLENAFAVFHRRRWWRKVVSRCMMGVRSSRSGTRLNVVLKLFCLLGTHSCEDVRGAGRQRGLAEAVMRNRISPGITVLR